MNTWKLKHAQELVDGMQGATVESVILRRSSSFVKDLPFMDIVFTNGLKITFESTTNKNGQWLKVYEKET